MKKLCAAATFIMMFSGAAMAQPPEGAPRDGDRANQERSRERDGDRDDREREGDERRPRDGQPGFGGRPGGFGGPPGGFMAMFPVMRALDADQDGELSAEEIENATAALKKIDRNNDGRIDGSEMRPEPPQGGFGGRGFGPPGADGRPQRPEMDEAQGDRGGRAPGTEEMIARMMNMDANGDGKLSKDELPEPMQAMLERADRNGDGSLDREEIAAVARARAGAGGDRPPGDRPPQDGRGAPSPEEFIQRILSRVDRDEDGAVSEDEAPEFIKGRFAELDKDSNGKLDKSELAAIGQMMRERGGRPPEGAQRREGGDRPQRDGAPAREDGERRRPQSDNP